LVPAFHRHFEADVPDSLASLSEPIRCSRVTFKIAEVERALLRIDGVHDVAVRCREDGSAEAFVAASDLDSSNLKQAISDVLPGYAVPDPPHVLPGKLQRNYGEVDFAAMEAEIAEINASAMSQQALLVRNIIGNLLATETGKIGGDSDFFLLGGYVYLAAIESNAYCWFAGTHSFWGNWPTKFVRKLVSVFL
jgi:hypothetical protein